MKPDRATPGHPNAATRMVTVPSPNKTRRGKRAACARRYPGWRGQQIILDT